MPDRFTLLSLSFSLILHNVCCWEVSEPLNPTFNDDGSVSVTCIFLGKEEFGLEAKLKVNNKIVCEILEKTQKDDKCKWQHNGNEFTFTLMNPENLHKNEFTCEISRVDPLPIITNAGPTKKLFRGCNNPLAPPKNNCSCSNETHITEPPPTVRTLPEDTFVLLICGLIIVVVLLSLYSIILTAAYIRLRVTMPKPSDNLTYVPMQRNVKRRDPDNTDYVYMREVQKREGSHRDMNHNSHLITV